MTSALNPRWTAVGILGSLVLANSAVAPTALANTKEATPASSKSPTVMVSLKSDNVGLRLQKGSSDTEDSQATDHLELGADTESAVPQDTEYGFLGKPGAPVWVLGDKRTSSQAAPRWDTSELPADKVANGTVDWSLTDVRGPGDVAVFELEGKGDDASKPSVLFNSTDGLPDTRTLPADDKQKIAWAFTRPGDYWITSAAEIRLPNGESKRRTTKWTVHVAEQAATEPAEPSSPANGDSSPQQGDEDSKESSKAPRPEKQAARKAKAAANDGSKKKTVIDDGHVDAVSGRMVGGKLRTLFKDSRNPSEAVWREPSSVVLHVKPKAKEKVPSGGYDFLGKAGSDFWLIPQVQKEGVVWAGWNTESLSSSDIKGALDMSVTKVSGPGSVAIWETEGLGGAKVLYNSKDGLPDTQKVNTGVHAHGNWGFSKEGVYKITFRLKGTLASGKTASDTRTYTIAVGDVDPNKVNPGGGGDSSTEEPSKSGSTGSSGDGSSSNADEKKGLAHTGSNSLPLTYAALALVLGGGVVVSVGSRLNRRRALRVTVTGDGPTPSSKP